jgi:hypothetical protein
MDGMTTLDSATLKKPLTAAIAGPLLLVLSFASSSSDGPPLAGATPAEIRAWAVDQGAALRLGAVTAVTGVIVLIVFTAALARVAGAGTAARVAAASGYLVAFCLLLTTVADVMPVALPGLIGADLTAVNDTILLAWWGAAGFTHMLGDFQAALIAATVGGFSLSALRTGWLPRWCAWAGVAVAAAAATGTVAVLTGVGAIYPFWFAGLFGWLLWSAAAGITLRLRTP